MLNLAQGLDRRIMIIKYYHEIPPEELAKNFATDACRRGYLIFTNSRRICSLLGRFV